MINVIGEVRVLRDNIKGGALNETTFLILLATCNPIHGYGIMQFIETETKARVTLGAGTLYGAINTFILRQNRLNWCGQKRGTGLSFILFPVFGGVMPRQKSRRSRGGQRMFHFPKQKSFY